jgi:hypothetical protein
MTDAELQDYQRHPEAYFGRVQPVSRRAGTPQEPFAFFIDAHRGLSRDALLQRVAAWPNFAQLKEMGDDDLLAEFCEGMVASFRTASHSSAEPRART